MFFVCFFVVFKQKTAYEVRISDWSSDVCSSDLFKHLAVEHKSFRQFEIDPESAAAAIILRILQPLRRAPTQQRKACRPKALRFRIDFEITQRGARIVPKGPDSRHYLVERRGQKQESIFPAGVRLSVDLDFDRSEEHTSELQSLMRISYAAFR